MDKFHSPSPDLFPIPLLKTDFAHHFSREVIVLLMAELEYCHRLITFDLSHFTDGSISESEFIEKFQLCRLGIDVFFVRLAKAIRKCTSSSRYVHIMLSSVMLGLIGRYCIKILIICIYFLSGWLVEFLSLRVRFIHSFCFNYLIISIKFL